MTTKQGNPSANALRTLAALQQAVTAELERKRRLGHYAVFWVDGKIVYEGEDAPVNHTDGATADTDQIAR